MEAAPIGHKGLEQNILQACSVLEGITDGFFALDREWRFIYVNASAEGLAGARRDEFLGRNYWEVFAPTLGTVVESEYRRSMRDRVTAEFDVFYEPWQRWFAIKTSPSVQGGLSICFRDVTGQKVADEELRRWRRFDTALSHTPDHTYIFDLEGRFTYANHALLSLFQRPLKEVLGKNFFDLGLPPELADLFQRQIQQVIDTKAPLRDNAPLTGPAAETRHYEYIFVPVLAGDGNVEAVAGSTRDITACKRAEKERERLVIELRRSNEDLEQFAAVASHDLRSPLETVVQLTQLLERKYSDILGDDALEYVGFVTSSVKRMRDLIDDLLRHSQVSAGEPEPVTSVSTEDMLGLATSNLRGLIEQTGATVTHDALGAVTLAPTHLVQLLQNLIANAIQYRDGKPSCVHVSAAEQGNTRLFSVRDNGIGIERKHQDRIFEPFKRLHGPEFPGSGLGLAVCRKIVNRAGGRIWVESELGQGSTFYFTLPC